MYEHSSSSKLSYKGLLMDAFGKIKICFILRAQFWIALLGMDNHIK